MISKTLERLRQNASIVPIVDTAMGTLIQSGVITFLRELGVPRIIDGGDSINKAAISAAMSAGYNACIDDLLNFKERFIVEKQIVTAKVPDYGAAQAVVESGDITKEEVDAIRSNKQFDALKLTEAERHAFAEFKRKQNEHNARLGAAPTPAGTVSRKGN